MPEPKKPRDKKLEQLAANLRPLHEAAGVPMPDGGNLRAPCIYVGAEGSRPAIQDLILQMTDLVRTRGLYKRHDVIGIIDEANGKFKPMTAHSFCSWIVLNAGISPHKGIDIDKETGAERLKKSDLGVEQARLILASEELLAKLPEIEYVNKVQLPVWREELDERDNPARKGFKKMELLEPGYDAQTKTFTVHSAPAVDESIDSLEAAEYLLALFKTFDWSDKEASGVANRMAVHLSCALTTVSRYLYHGKSPFFIYVSNLEGSGKGALVRAALLPVFRRAGPDDIDLGDPKELRNVLNTKAGVGSPFLWVEELPENWNLNDKNLARWATTEMWPFRPMGQNREMMEADITKMQTVVAANRITVDRNIGRRSLMADLFPMQEAAEKKLPEGTQLLSAEFFADPENLNKLLSCYIALLRGWDDAGRPKSKDRSLESFEGWSEIVPAVIECMNLGSPLVPFVAAGSGDDDSRQMKRLVQMVIDRSCFSEVRGQRTPLAAVTVTMKDIVRIARENDLFVERLGALDQIYDDLNAKKGHKWKDVVDTRDAELIDDDEGPSWPSMRDPTDAEKRSQAAEYIDEKVGSAWGKFFRRQAVDERPFLSTCGIAYKFGDRGSSRKSQFVLRRLVTQ